MALQQKKKFEKEAEKILANRVLSGVKAICRLEKEKRGEGILKEPQRISGIQNDYGGS